MVFVGLTAWVPPLGCKAYELPSVPVTVTNVAFVADTVKADELPGKIEVGVAVILTAGDGFELSFKEPPPHPFTNRAKGRLRSIATDKMVRKKESGICTFIGD